MSKAVNKSSMITELRDDIDVLSEISRRLMMDDFVTIENELSFENRSEKDAEIVHITQHCTNHEYSGTAEENLSEYEPDIENSEWEREVLVDEQYWKHYGAVTQRVKIKYLASQRMTIRQLTNIANYKSLIRDPSYFKFDSSTTATLEALIADKYVGPLHNIVSKGRNSVVIHANSPETGVVRIWFPTGNAVKVYRLTNDVKKNNVLLKRAQREYEHLLSLQCLGHVPYVVHKMKNVLIFNFIGDNQETAPTITKLPSKPKDTKRVYHSIVSYIKKSFSKCNIVHGNLCPKNILCIEKFVIIIGWGYSVKRDHPHALIKLMKDCYFVTNFFRRRDVPVKSTENLFKYITGLDKISNKLLDLIQKKDLWQDGHLTNPNRY